MPPTPRTSWLKQCPTARGDWQFQWCLQHKLSVWNLICDILVGSICRIYPSWKWENMAHWSIISDNLPIQWWCSIALSQWRYRNGPFYAWGSGPLVVRPWTTCRHGRTTSSSRSQREVTINVYSRCLFKNMQLSGAGRVRDLRETWIDWKIGYLNWKCCLLK